MQIADKNILHTSCTVYHTKIPILNNYGIIKVDRIVCKDTLQNNTKTYDYMTASKCQLNNYLN